MWLLSRSLRPTPQNTKGNRCWDRIRRLTIARFGPNRHMFRIQPQKLTNVNECMVTSWRINISNLLPISKNGIACYGRTRMVGGLNGMPSHQKGTILRSYYTTIRLFQKICNVSYLVQLVYRWVDPVNLSATFENQYAPPLVTANPPPNSQRSMLPSGVSLARSLDIGCWAPAR